MQSLPGLRRFAFRLKLAASRRTPVAAGRLIAYAIGTLFWLFDANGRKIVERNLAHFIPARDGLLRCVRRNYICFTIYLYESFRMDRLPAWYFSEPHLTFSDPYGAFRNKPTKGPIIVVSVHSHWELIAMVLGRLGLIEQIDAVALSSGDEEIDRIFKNLRKSANSDSIDLKQAPLGSLRALKAGRIIGIVADRDYTGNGIMMPFAGERMRLPLGPAALAVQTGATIVPLFLARRGLMKMQMIVGKPIVANPNKSKAEEVDRIMNLLSVTMMRFLASAPAQWVAFHDAWDSREKNK
jgi:phosphatidylinositol dimannoside acyltransferase